jgi:V8-like Glu-specific endopeptidase
VVTAVNVKDDPNSLTKEQLENVIPLDIFVRKRDSNESSPLACSSTGTITWRTNCADPWYSQNTGIGRVFISDGTNLYGCSGVVGGHNYIWTAGHCCYSSGVQFTWYKFQPNYCNNYNPTLQATGVYSPWSTGNDWTRDYCILTFPAQSFPAAQYSSQYAKLRQIANSKVSTTTYTSEGYPIVPTSTKAFNGEYDNTCQSSNACRDTSITPTLDYQPVGIACDDTEGSSGGPWIVACSKRTDPRCITGVNSYAYPDTVNGGLLPWVYSSHFNAATKTFCQGISGITCLTE